MQAATAITLTALPVLPWWAFPELWVAGAARKVGRMQAHVNYAGEDCRTVGAPVGLRPLEEACEELRKQAKEEQADYDRAIRERREQVVMIANLERRYALAYTDEYPFVRYKRIADQLGLTVYEVADALDEATLILALAS
jgi:hypothetical protein